MEVQENESGQHVPFPDEEMDTIEALPEDGSDIMDGLKSDETDVDIMDGQDNDQVKPVDNDEVLSQLENQSEDELDEAMLPPDEAHHVDEDDHPMTPPVSPTSALVPYQEEVPHIEMDDALPDQGRHFLIPCLILL